MSGVPETAGLVTSARILENRRARRPHVLVAEDNQVNQKIASIMLEKSGCRVDVANDGREAVDACARTSYSAILMDCQMPVMDGYEAAQRIREQESGDPRTPIIAMTASAMAGDRERCLAAGMDDYVSKPIDRQTLLAVLSRWLPRPVPTSAEPDPVGTEVLDPVLDPVAVQQLLRLGDAAGFEVLQELLDLFDRDTPQRVAALREALTGRDAAAVEFVAHSLKGSVLTLGATRAGELCSRLEQAGRHADLDGTEEVLCELDVQLGAVRDALGQVVASGRAGDDEAARTAGTG